MSLIDQIVAYLKKASQAERTQFMTQFMQEKDLYDALKHAGFDQPHNAVDETTPQEKAITRPNDVLSTVQKIDLVTLADLISLLRTETLADAKWQDWINADPTTISLVASYTDAYDYPVSNCMKFAYSQTYLYLYRFFDTNLYPNVLFWGVSDHAGATIKAAVEYQDGTSTIQTINLTTSWTSYQLSLTPNKIAAIIMIGVCGGTSGSNDYIARPALVRSDNVIINAFPSSWQSYIRWGIPREPAWIDGSEATAPAANTNLVSKTVTSGKTGRVFGVHITADEGNRFQLGGTLSGTTTIYKDFEIGIAGTVHIVLPMPLLDSIAAGTAVFIRNVTLGSSGKVYQASLLYDEA